MKALRNKGFMYYGARLRDLDEWFGPIDAAVSQASCGMSMGLENEDTLQRQFESVKNKLKLSDVETCPLSPFPVTLLPLIYESYPVDFPQGCFPGQNFFKG